MGVIGGAELRASEATTDEPGYSSITALDNGGWVVTWNYTAANSATILGVRSQVFNADGTTNGSQVQVATGNISELETIATADGGWLVASTRYADWHAWLQAYHADGSLDGSSFFASDNPGSYQIDLSASPLEDGGYILSWSENRDGWYQIYQQRFDAQGASVGGEISVTEDDNLASMSRSGQVAALEDGGWVTTWSTLEYYPVPRGVIAAKIYNADGSLREETLLVDPDSMASEAIDGVPYINQADPEVVGLSNGGFVVTYTIGAAENAIVWQEYFKIFNADGTALTSYLPLNDNWDSTTLQEQTSPAIEALDNGRFIAVWQADAKDGWGWGIYSQLFNADGSRNGDATLVNTTTDDEQFAPSLTVLKDGRWVISWTDANGTDKISQKVFSYVTDAPEGSDKTFGISDSGHHSFAAADFGFSDSNNDAMAGVFITGLPEQGSLTLNGEAVSEGEFVTTADLAKLKWTPPHNDIGDALATLTFKVKDAGDITDGGANLDHSANTLTFNVYHVSLAPSGTDQTVTVLEDTDRVLTKEDFGFVDDPGENSADHFTGIIITAVRGHGSLGLSDQSFQWNYNEVISIDDISKIFIRPNADHNGNGLLQLDFKVVDDGGTAHGGHNTSATTNTLTIDVTAVNDAPTGADKTLTYLEDSGRHVLSADLFGFSDTGDSAAPNSLSKVIIDKISGGGVFLLGNAEVHAGDIITTSQLASFTFQPSGNGAGAGYASLKFRLVDNGGAANGGTDTETTAHTLTFGLTGVNDAPTGADKTLTYLEDSGKHVLAADLFGFSDTADAAAPDTLAKIIIDKIAGKGTFMLGKSEVHAGDEIKTSALADLSFQSAKNEFGAGYASLKFRLVDDGGTTNGGLDTEAVAHTLKFKITDVVDKFIGTSGKNVLRGTAGHDILDGKGGKDKLTGLGGSDTFVFGKGYGKDVITDFDVKGSDHDTLDLRNLNGVDSFRDLIAHHIEKSGADVIITGNHSDQVTLSHVRVGDLAAADFLF